jgi:hypothetical protein
MIFALGLTILEMMGQGGSGCEKEVMGRVGGARGRYSRELVEIVMGMVSF